MSAVYRVQFVCTLFGRKPTITTLITFIFVRELYSIIKKMRKFKKKWLNLAQKY